jgi:SH3-like domain-containing protein
MKKSQFNWIFEGLLLIAGIFFVMSSCQNSKVNKLQSEVNHIASQWVPDQRVGICNVKIKSVSKGTIILTGETTNKTAKAEIIKALNNHYKSLIDSIIIIPDTINNQKYFGLVTLSVINLRKEPKQNSELVSQARLGTPVLILKENNSWVMIQTPDNYIAWTEESSLKLLTRKELEVWKSAPKVIYRESTGWLKDSTSVNSGVVGDLVGGCIMEKTGELNGYVSVALPDGRKGCVEKQKVMDFDTWKSTVSCTGESICSVARTFLGIPYLWGGSSAKAVDCSGFVQSVYFMNGLILSRDASLQALHGSDVDITYGYGKLRKGDLLFFGLKEKGTNRVTHVAIYIGDNEYINASGRVVINSLDPNKLNYNSRRITSLLAAKRIIGVENDMGIVPVFKHSWY